MGYFRVCGGSDVKIDISANQRGGGYTWGGPRVLGRRRQGSGGGVSGRPRPRRHRRLLTQTVLSVRPVRCTSVIALPVRNGRDRLWPRNQGTVADNSVYSGLHFGPSCMYTVKIYTS